MPKSWDNAGMWMGMRNIAASTVLLLVLLCLGHSPGDGQVGGERREAATTCEENEAVLDNVGVILLKNADKRLIVIAHLGRGESSSDLIDHRLYNASEYILRRAKLPRERIIIARGERTKGLGRVDLWVDGKIVDSLFVDKNKSLCVDCCENRPIPPYKKNSWRTKL